MKRNRVSKAGTSATSLPLCSLFAQNLGHSIHDSQVGAQSIMQTLVVNPGLRLCIGQCSLAFDHTFGKPAARRQLLSWLGYARAPTKGYTRDGEWGGGVGYPRAVPRTHILGV